MTQTCKECGFEQTIFGICERCGYFNEYEFDMFVFKNRVPSFTTGYKPEQPKRIRVKEIAPPYETPYEPFIPSLSKWRQRQQLDAIRQRQLDAIR